MSIKFETKEAYQIEDLLSIMSLLRSEDGCPWDKEQTHKSIRNNFIEETYEACEAIDLQDEALLKEELGDVLLQVVFHSRLEEEAGHFSFDSVCDGICKKLILRHPHIFGDGKAADTAAVLKKWEEIKQESKGQKNQTEAVKSVPKTFPALMRAQKVQKRAGKSGFDFPDVYDAMGSLENELEELQTAIEDNDPDSCAEELGDVIFSAVNVARFLNLDSEESLSASTEKFIARFSVVEELATSRKINLQEASMEELEALWQEAKKEAAQSVYTDCAK